MKEQFGPQGRIQDTSMTCRGCGYYERVGQVFGHDFRKDNTYCNHPEVKPDKYTSLMHAGKGKQIEFMTQSHNANVPHWCPFINPK